MKKAKATGVARPAKPPRPAVQQLQHQVHQLQQQVHQLQRAGSPKHSGTSKHNQHAKKSAKHSPRRGWSPDEDVQCCSARALATALKLAGGPVLADADVLALHAATSASPDTGQSILEALSAAQGLVPVSGRLLCPATSRDPWEQELASSPRYASALILGLDLPWGEPHAVTYDLVDGVCWSWGEPYNLSDFPGAVIDEAWAVAA